MWPSHLLPALLAPLAAASLDPRALAAPRLASYELNGVGCPVPGASTISGSTSSLSLTLPDFISEIRGTERRDFNRNCLAVLRIEEGVPGYRLAIRRVQGEGMFFGSPDVRLRLQSVAYFQNYERLQVVNTAYFNASSEASTLRPVSYDFDFEPPNNRVFSQCVGDDRYVGTAFVNIRAIVNWPDENSYGAFLGTEENPVTENIEFAWIACDDVEEPTPEELEEGGEAVIGDGAEEGGAVLIGGDVEEGVVEGGDEGEDEVVLDEDGE